MSGLITRERNKYHFGLIQKLLVVESGTGRSGGVRKWASNADKDSALSRAISYSIAKMLNAPSGNRLDPQTSGREFEVLTCRFIAATFPKLQKLRPGDWRVEDLKSKSADELARFDQYRHLADITKILEANPDLKAVIANDYQISPDITVSRQLEPEQLINGSGRRITDGGSARYASLREINGGLPILHANISCKWTIRSDRAQNSRSEALNMIRNRKGRVPHIAIVTAEPLPARLASLALGTGDIDCVYHVALPELEKAVELTEDPEAAADLATMIDGRRLRDISDLPLDLAI